MVGIVKVKRSTLAVCEFEWSISEFASLSTEGSPKYFSPYFELLEESCDFSISCEDFKSSPPSTTQKDTLQYFNISFYMDISQTLPTVPEVSFAIKTADGKKDHERHDPCQILYSEYLQYSAKHYISRAELLDRASELMPSNILTVICTVRYLECVDGKSDSETSTCTHCERIFNAKSFHEKNCWNKLVKCLDCSQDIYYGCWSDHECQSTKKAGETGPVKCIHCQELVDAKTISLHEKKCLIKCPKCSEVVACKNWHDHEFQKSKQEGETGSSKCTHCQEIVDAKSISHHEKKCLIKCPECSEVVLLKNWHDHEYQTTKPEGEVRTFKTVSHVNNALNDFKELFLQKEDCDVVLKVKDQDFPAHKNILKARSAVFASTFRTDMKEKATGVVEIDDCDPSCFSDFLCFLYCADVSLISQENVFGLFTAADKYNVRDLRDKCMEFVKENLSVDTFCDTMTLALLYLETELIELATNFFTKNAPDIVLTVKWQIFLAENPTQCNELLVKLLKPGSSVKK